MGQFQASRLISPRATPATEAKRKKLGQGMPFVPPPACSHIHTAGKEPDSISTSPQPMVSAHQGAAGDLVAMAITSLTGRAKGGKNPQPGHGEDFCSGEGMAGAPLPMGSQKLIP